MRIITAREFRGEQGKYLRKASMGESVIIKSRDYGSFRLMPITEDDALMSKDEFFKMLEKAEEEIQEGKGKKFGSADEAISYFKTL